MLVIKMHILVYIYIPFCRRVSFASFARFSVVLANVCSCLAWDDVGVLITCSPTGMWYVVFVLFSSCGLPLCRRVMPARKAVWDFYLNIYHTGARGSVVGRSIKLTT
jgi:hypothetical protein